MTCICSICGKTINQHDSIQFRTDEGGEIVRIVHARGCRREHEEENTYAKTKDTPQRSDE